MASRKRSVATLQRELTKGRSLELRRAGATVRAIAEAVGLSKSRVHQVLSQALADARRDNDHAVEELRALEDERLDGLLLAVYSHATGKPTIMQLHCVDRVLRIMAARARLHGLDAPVKVARTTPDGEGAPDREWVMVLPTPAASLEEWAAEAEPPPAPPPSE